MRRTPFLWILLACMVIAAYLFYGRGGDEPGGGAREAGRGESPPARAPDGPALRTGAAAEPSRENTKRGMGEADEPQPRSTEAGEPPDRLPPKAPPTLPPAGTGDAGPVPKSAPTPGVHAARRTVRVRVVKEGIEEPLPGALVVLVDAKNRRHEARTNKAGDADLHDVAPKRGTVDAVADGWVARWKLDVEVAGEGDTQPTVIRMRPAAVVAGVVRAARSKEPVAGARVIAVAGGRVHESQGWISSSRGEYAATTTGASGEFRFRALPTGEVSTLAVLARGYRYTLHGLIPAAEPASREAVEILLEAGGQLIGHVTSADGDPVRGATVYVVPEEDERLAQNPRRGRLGKPVASMRGTTVSDGSFEVIGLSFGQRLAAIAEGEGHQRSALVDGLVVSLAAPTATAVLRLEGLGAVRVSVVDAEGQVVSGAGVSCSHGPQFRRRARTDAEGVARCSDVPQGKCRVRVVRKGFVAVNTAAVVVAGGTTEVEVRLEPKPPGVELSGVVVDPEGQPISAVRVFTQRSRLIPAVEATTDQSGRFVLADLPAGPVTIVARKKGYAQGRQEVEAPASDVRIAIGRWAKIRGQVELPKGVTKPPFILIVREMLEQTLGGGGSSVPFQDGTFESVLTPATRTRIAICGDSFAPWTTDVWVDHGQTKDLGTIRVESGVALAGLVVAKDGSPVQGVVVTIELHLMVRRTATTDASGRFRLEHLAPGTHSIKVLAPGHDEQEQVEAAQVARDDVRIVLRTPR